MLVISWVYFELYLVIFCQDSQPTNASFLLLYLLVVEILVVIAYQIIYIMMSINKIKEFMLTKVFIHD